MCVPEIFVEQCRCTPSHSTSYSIGLATWLFFFPPGVFKSCPPSTLLAIMLLTMSGVALEHKTGILPDGMKCLLLYGKILGDACFLHQHVLNTFVFIVRHSGSSLTVSIRACKKARKFRPQRRRVPAGLQPAAILT